MKDSCALVLQCRQQNSFFFSGIFIKSNCSRLHAFMLHSSLLFSLSVFVFLSLLDYVGVAQHANTDECHALFIGSCSSLSYTHTHTHTQTDAHAGEIFSGNSSWRQEHQGELGKSFDFTPQNTNDITQQHTRFIIIPRRYRLFLFSFLFFCCWVTATKADVIYQLQATKHYLLVMVTFTGAFALQSKVTHSHRTTHVKLTWLMAGRESMWAIKAFGGRVNTAPDYWITSLSKLVTKDQHSMQNFINFYRH